MSWLIVVGGVIALALAVHVAEQRRSRAVMLARRKQRSAASEAPRFSLSREVRETWAVDLETMRLELTRSDEPGSATFLDEIIAWVRETGGEFVGLPQLCETL